QQYGGIPRYQLRDVVEHIVASLVAGHENNLRGAHFGDRSIEHDNSLRRTNSCHVGIQGGRLLCRAHPEHPFWRNVLACALQHVFQSYRECRSLLSKWLELVEEWIDNQRLKEEQAQRQRKRSKPKVEPPATRTASNHCIEN